ncbi:MAG: hypothetical protein Roseis2KO_17200 [Roseivirga sp.]
MDKENLHNDLRRATGNLLEMARDASWNSISDNCLYIIREINHDTAKNFFERRKIRKRVNRKKEPKTLNSVVSELERIYENLYDVNLLVYKSTAQLTIVEIQYYPKSLLDKDYFEEVKDKESMLHCKVSIPPYSRDEKSKLDINWELGGLRHSWKLYWWKRRMNRELSRRKAVSNTL